MSPTRRVAASVAVLLVGTVLVTGPASAQEPATTTTVAGTTESTQAVLDLDLGSVLDLELLTERALADVTNSSNALSTITGLSVASSVVPALNVALAQVTAQQPGGAPSAHESFSVGGTLGTLVPSLGALGTVLDSGGVVGGDLLDLNVSALAEQVRSAASGASQLARLQVLSGVLNASAVHTGVLQGSNTDTASVARSMHIDALGILNLGSLFELLGIPLTSLSLDDLGTLASSLGVVVEGLPGGSTLAGFSQPLLDTLGALLGDQAATVGSLTAPVQGVLTTLIGSTPASDTEVGELPVPTLLSDLVTQITDLLTGLLGDLSGMPLIQLNAIDLSAAANAVGTLEGSSADAGCTLGSVQIGALPAIDLSAVTTAIGQVGTVLDQLPFGLGDLLELSVCGQSILGAVPQTVVESVAMAGQAVEARSSASAVHFGIEPGAVLTGLVGGTPLESLFGQAGGLSLPELPAIPGLVDLSPLVGSGNVMAEGMDLDVGRVSARATYQATPVAIPVAPTPAPETPTALPSTGGDAALPLLAAALLLPLALAGRRFALARSRTTGFRS